MYLGFVITGNLRVPPKFDLNLLKYLYIMKKSHRFMVLSQCFFIIMKKKQVFENEC